MTSSLHNHSNPVASYTHLPVFTLLQQLLPILRPFKFGVGGSLLLAELGLLQQVRDLDLVCVAEDFERLTQALRDSREPVLQQVTVPPHPLYQSEFFARFVDPAGTEIDVMANIRVKQPDKMQEWRFDESQLQLRHTIPWMSATQWIELYQLFQRPERVAMLRQWLNRLHSDDGSLN
jgi:hypothetical protein